MGNRKLCDIRKLYVKMGNCGGKQKSSFLIYVRTGDRKNAGTDANVRIVLYDIEGRHTEELVLDNFFRNDFEVGSLDTFPVKNLSGFGNRVAKIEFWRDDAGVASDWFVDRILVENKSTNDIFVFPVYRWIKSGWQYIIKKYDTSLPQFDEHKDQRSMELGDKRKLYVLEQKLPELPMQVSMIV